MTADAWCISGARPDGTRGGFDPNRDNDANDDLPMVVSSKVVAQLPTNTRGQGQNNRVRTTRRYSVYVANRYP